MEQPSQAACSPTQAVIGVSDSRPAWTTRCQKLNVTASISAHDLTGDGVADPIVNVVDGDAPYQVVALDGTNGTQLWGSEDGITMITVAQFADLNGDGTPDVVVGGRGVPVDDRPLVALDGSDGSTLWRVAAIEPDWRNVYTPQRVKDRDGDGVDDWLVATGGDWLRTAAEPVTVPGRLVVVGGADGAVLAQIDLPDGQETYNSPVLVRTDEINETVLIGSGGELLPGALWKLPLDAIFERTGDAFEQVASGDAVSSFIAPVSLGDLDRDGRTEAVALRMDGQLIAFDPSSGAQRWVSSVHDAVGALTTDAAVSSLAVPAIGQLDDDAALEVVALHTRVTAEQLASGDVYDGDSVLVVYDGATGAVEHRLDGPAVGAVVSPLIASSGGMPGVVCACAMPLDAGGTAGTKRTDRIDLGWWQPGQVEHTPTSFGVPATESMTPLFSGVDGKFRLLSGGIFQIGDKERSIVSAIVPGGAMGPIDRVEWGGYMGVNATGHGT